MNPILRVRLEREGRGPGDRLPSRQMLIDALRRRMILVAEFVRSVWAHRAMQTVSDTGAYVRGITTEGRVEITFEESGEDRIRATLLVTNTAKHARIVEDGHSAFHLPDRINWSDPMLRIKRGRTGRPYMHIPFRHYTEAEAGDASGPTRLRLRSMMPDHIYEMARALQRRVNRNMGPMYAAGGFRSSDGTEHRGQLFAQADLYRWHGARAGRDRRLQFGPSSPGVIVLPDGRAMVAHKGARLVTGGIGKGPGGTDAVNPAWQTNKYEGLMKTGAPGHTRYLTIRTITPDSPGWWIPSRHGHGIRRQVVMTLRHGKAADQLRKILGGAIIEEVT